MSCACCCIIVTGPGDRDLPESLAASPEPGPTPRTATGTDPILGTGVCEAAFATSLALGGGLLPGRRRPCEEEARVRGGETAGEGERALPPVLVGRRGDGELEAVNEEPMLDLVAEGTPGDVVSTRRSGE
jgi:hypothetical protein